MTDGTALLRAVLAQPAEDTPRLVYADWLDESGDHDRAEFIRGQIRLASLDSWDEGYTALDVRCRQLERAHPEWMTYSNLPAEIFRTGTAAFNRGFPWCVQLTPTQFREHRQALFAETPVRCVRFSFGEGHRQLAKLMQPGLLSGFEFFFVVSAASARAVRACLDRLESLEHFGFWGSLEGFSPSEREPIFASAALDTLRSLNLSNSGNTGTELANRPLPHLRKFCVESGRAGLFLRSSWLPQLDELDLPGTFHWGDEDPRLFIEVLANSSIRRLSYGCVDVKDAAALGAVVAKSRIRSLTMPALNRTAGSAEAFLRSEVLRNLHALSLGGGAIELSAIERLAESRLRVCALTHVTEEGLAVFLRPPGHLELAELRLDLLWRSKDDLIPEKLCAALEAGLLPRLVSLTLLDADPPFGDGSRNWPRVATVLAKCPAVAQLRHLELYSVTPEGAFALANSLYLDGIQVLITSVYPWGQDPQRALDERFGSHGGY